jgi:mannose-6-phosphate isomerase-like protein (cupin superfamily)
VTGAARATLVATLLALTLVGCHGRRTPPAPAASRAPDVEALRTGGEPALTPYLEAFPLGERGVRVDLLASTPERSLHFVQARRPIPRHVHPARTETVYVLRGTGTCYVGDRSYPIAPGATFHVAPGVPHSAIPDDGVTVVAVSYMDPPLLEDDDRVLVPADSRSSR